ncbi:MAG: hypothetical protein AAF926_04830 [Pseudomonadota bacterium]
MKRGYLVIGMGAVLCTGCATVDLQSMAGTDAQAVSVSEPEGNVVERAVAKLRAVFASRGFGEKSSKKKMQAAANVLLNGLNARISADPDYMDVPRLVAEVREDMSIATVHVDQTTRAAEIYLEVAPIERDLSGELDSLQAALLASEKAARGFTTALDDYEAGSSQTNPDMAQFRTSVDALRDVTDAFGDRVRQTRTIRLGLEPETVG